MLRLFLLALAAYLAYRILSAPGRPLRTGQMFPKVDD